MKKKSISIALAVLIGAFAFGQTSFASIVPLTSFSNTQQSTASTTLQNSDVVISGSSLQNGVDYLILYSVSYGGNSTSEDPVVSVMYGSTTIANGADEGSSSGTPEAMRVGSLEGYYILTGDGVSDLRIQYRSTRGGTCYIAGKSLIAIPLEQLTLNQDYWFATQNGDAAVMSTTSAFSDLLSTNLNLTESGDYLVLASAEGWTPSGSTSNGEAFRFQVNSTIQKATMAKEWENNAARRSFSYARIHTLNAGVNNFVIQGGPAQGTASKSFRRGRIIVIKANTFDQMVSAVQNSDVTTTANHPTYDNYITNTYTPNQQEYVVIIGNTWGYQGQNARSVVTRLANTTDNIYFSDFISDDAKDITVDRVMFSVFGAEEISSAKTYAFQVSGESSYTTANHFQYGDLIVWSLTPLGDAPPVIAPIGPKSTNELQNLNFTVTATDPNGTTPLLTAESVPASATFTDHSDGTGTFDWTPGSTDNGIYLVSFIASDGALADTEVVSITVYDPGTISVINRISSWTTGLTHTVGSGNNRMLVFAVGHENNGDAPISSVTYGGQTMIRVVEATTAATGFQAHVELWYLNEAGITAATSNQFTVNYTSTAPTDPMYAAASYENVNQTTPIFDFGSNSTTTATPNPITATMNATFNGLSIGTALSGNDGSYTWNNGWTEGYDQSSNATCNMSGADYFESATGTTTASATHSGPNRQAIAALSLQPAPAPQQPPVVSDIPDQTIDEGSTFATISLDNYVDDPDNVDSEISWTYSGNTELSVNIDASRVATITIPSSDWYGSETITFTATDPDLLSDSDPATFTVNNINDAPVVSDIPDQTVDEGSTFTTINLDDFVSDIDNADSEINWTYSGNTELTININASRVATITIPSVDWNGSETITFTATDPGLLSDNDPATFTVNAINDAPVVSDIPDQTVDEGSTFATINLDNYVNDVDNADSEINWTYSGNTELTVNINASRVATISIPGIEWNGSETITFTATDPGLLSDSDPAVFTVNAINDAPVVSDIPDQTIDEGSTFATINLDDYVSDIDNADSEINWTYSGNTELTVNINASRVATITIPSSDWNGSETITLTAIDPGLLSDSDPAVFTVNALNDAPIVSDIPDQTIDEGSTFATVNLDDYVSDVDNADSEINWTYSGNTELSVSIDASRIATITIPSPTWNGSETITFTATDPGLLSDSDPAAFTVTAVNDSPVVSDIPDQTIDEGSTFATINLDDFVTDADNTDAEMTWTYSGNTELSVSIDGSRVATITIPSADWFGTETITFTATDPGLLSDSDPATFTVNNINDAPVVSDIPDQTIDEGSIFATINLDDYVSDIDNADSEINWTYSGNTELTVNINASRVATITIPNVDWNGAETITFTATDPGLLSDNDPATFTVNAVNDAPVVTDIPDRTILEGTTFSTINLDSYVSDVDNADSEINWTYSGNTELTVSIDASHVATITIPSSDWFGAETITFTATDPGLLSDSDPAIFTVNGINDPPVVSDIPNQTIDEGLTFATINLDDFVSDVDNADAEIDWTYSGNTELAVSIDASRIATITAPNVDWFGSETITFTATDPGVLSDSDPATFTVNAVNDAPVVTDIPNQAVTEGSNFTTISLDDFVSDVDNGDAEMTWTYSGNTELTVNIDASRIATITIPSPTWNGSETITFTATDPGLLSDSDPATFAVTAVNDPPVVSDIPDQTIDEGSTFATINLDDFVTDPDNTDAEMTWMYSGNTELSVSIDASRIATITIPSADWFGTETITFTATDPGLLSDSDPATFTVNNINDAPIVSDIPDQTIDEGSTFATINLDNYVSDIDNADSEINWTYSGNTELTVNIDASRIATITIPTTDWNGAETVTFTATDLGLLSDNDPAVFTVNAINDAPVVTDIPDQTIDEGSTFATINLDDFVSDVDNADAEMSWIYSGNTELAVSIDASHVATITIPSSDWFGSETITFTATDPGLLGDSDPVTFTVNNINDAPVVSDIPDQTIDEGLTFATINLDDFVADIDNADAEINWTYSGNTELSVSIDGSRVATISAPDADWNGSETITFTATDPGLLSDSDPATFTVNAVNDAPVVADIPNQLVDEGVSFATINLDDFVSDVDNSDAEMTWTYSGNTELTVGIDGSRVATITIPSPTWNGSETITFTATDPGLLSDSDPATFTVSSINDAPVVSDIPDQTIDEGSTFATINLDDFVTDPDNPDAEMTWTYSGNTELSVSIDGSRVATITIPSADWNGAETITFTATDPGLLADSDAATFTVNSVNDAPVVTNIPDQTIDEGSTFATINLDDFVSDVDNSDAEMTWSYAGNVELTVNIDASHVATITIPSIDWNGVETITFTATDPGLLSDNDPAVFTVNAINDAPIVSDIPDQTIDEVSTFATINLDDFVSDVDNADAEMSWTYSGNTELTVSIDASRIATITAPDADWFGSETITFTATDPGLLGDSDPVTFTVNNINDAPVVSDIPDQTIDEGSTFATINLDNFVSDVDNADAEINWTYSGNTELTVNIDAGHIAAITIPSTDWNGSETITFTATDPGLLSDSDPATFTVNAVNDAPVVTDIPDQTIDEGLTFATINLDDYVSDVDNSDAEISWTYSGNTELTINIDASRVATITIPGAEWYGSETITFTATDPGLLSDSDPAVFTVNNINDAPVVSDIPDQTVAEGTAFATINLDDFVADNDNADNEITWTYSGQSNLNVSIDGSRVATITPVDPNWNGTETITFTATDPGLLFASDAATFMVTAVNDAPVVSGIPDQTIAEGASFTTINLDNYVTDVDNVDADMIWTKSGNTELLVDITNRVATIIIPSPGWVGSETITFRATDPGLLFGEDAATFTVTNVNDAPVVSDIPDQTVAEGDNFVTISLDDYVSDVDNTDAEMTWSATGQTDLTVDIDASHVATITIPYADWNGAETITFTATDPGLLTGSDPATFTVTAVNDAPVVADIPDQTIDEGQPFAAIDLDNFVSDVDNAAAEMTWTYSGNTELTVSIDASRVATITAPDGDWNGAETITFTATDPGLLADSDPATFTVNAVNDAPVVTDIPDQTIDEGSAFATIDLNTYVTDIDNLASEMTWSYSGNTELAVSIDASNTATVTTPNADWFGTETITFTATDPGLLSDSDPATFTVNNINDAPVVSDIPDQTVAEGSPFATINLDDFVSDVDNADNEITWSYSGDANLSVSIDAGRVATITAIDPDWNGSETITFTATDPGLLFDSDPATFTVTAVNDAPVVSGIPDQAIPEGFTFAQINLDNYVTDVDNTDAQMTWTKSGNVELLVDITNRVATIIIPSAQWNGSETITFTATDPGLLSGSDAATFTVSANNDAPVVTTIPNQTINEGSTFTTINLDAYVSDVDNTDAEMTWTTSGETDLTVSIDASRVATITIPSADWYGSETITFRATDPGLLFDETSATFTVNNINDAPVVSDIPDQTVAEGTAFATINLDDFVTDIDNADNQISWTTSGETNLSVSINASRVATITSIDPDWNGSETITFTATDPGLLFASDAATFTVTAVNDAPVVSGIPDQTIPEGSSFATINLDDYAADVDNLDSELGWTYSGNTELTVSIDAAHVATISIPSADWNGSETITFTATDPGLLTGSDNAIFTVTAVNDAPVVSDIPDQTIDEGATFATINLDDYVTDIDNTDAQMTWTYSGNVALSVGINASHVATITTPTVDWNGSETITFTATDPGLLSDNDVATFTVNAVNDAPVVLDIPNQTISEGSSFAIINLDDYVADPDNADNQMSWSYSGQTDLIVNISSRVATIAIPNADWFGSETITFTATDPGLLSDSDPATFTVTNVNDAPVVADIPNQATVEGGSFATINLDDYVSDVDNLDAEMTWTYSGNVELSVSIDASHVATVTTPSPTWNGSETITFRATDPGLLFDEDAATFTVSATNDPPVVSNIPDQTIPEGSSFATINLDNYVDDIDNTDAEITWTYSGNTELSVSIDASRVVTITVPNADWNGAETITFTATDPGLLSDSDPATFTVTAVNDAPVVLDIPDQTIAEGASFTQINLDNYVTDVDNTPAQMIWTKSGNVELLVDISNRIATIIIPNSEWSGSETITFRATDPGSLFGEDVATFTVTAVNDAPVVTDIPNQTVPEGGSFTTINLDDYVSDLDNTDAEMTWTASGQSELSVTIDVSRVATISIPSADWYGSETITFRATDPGLLFDEDAATFTVTNINDAPVVSDVPDQTIAEGASFVTINLDDYVTDIDNADSQIGWTTSGATELSVSISPSRVATINIPTVDWNGSETITFTATDPGLLSDSDPATFTVTAVNDAPVVSDIPDQAVPEGGTFATINLDNYVTDVDNADSEIDWTYSGNTELTVAIDASRIATITTPSPTWNGSETITFTATDPGLLSDSDPATFTVSSVNNPPVVTDIPDQTIDEGGTFATINLDDYVSDVDNADAEITWTYSGNTDLLVDIDVNRVATITTPNADWNGAETITFTATDPGLLANSDAAAFTVNPVNDAPVVADIPDQTIAEGATFLTINLDNFVNDIDNADAEINWVATGQTELSVTIDANRTATVAIPNADWNGSETITFTATDPGLLSDSDPATFTVTAVNDAPVVTDIPDQTVAEGSPFATINLDDFVSDVDNADAELTWSYSGNTELTVVIDASRIATVTTPSPTWNGSETITFTATDPGLLFDSDAAAFTVTGVNNAPVVSDIPDQTIAEGFTFATINLDDYVSDIDNADAEISWTYGGNTELTVSISTARVATIGIPNINWNGSETITFTATDPGLLTDSDPATFTVTAVNDAPVVSNITNQTITEGGSFTTINLDDYVSDVDNPDADINWSYSGNVELSVSIDGNRVATVGIPTPDWNGSETITFTATDPGLLSDSDDATFTVNPVNDAPVVADIPDQTIAEGGTFATINLDDYVNDIDNPDSDMNWTYSGNVQLIVSIDVNRVATITTPNADWNGSETITFRATDPNFLFDTDAATFTATPVNDAPVVLDIPDQTVDEGSAFTLINLDDYVSDIDNLDNQMTWSYSGNTDLIINIVNRVATITIPYVDWNGSETVTFTATDPGLLFSSDAATFTVNAVNDAPVVSNIPDQIVGEGGSFTSINLDDYVSDVDNTDAEMTWTYSGNVELTVAIDGARVATITTPSVDWNGSETITFTATDPGLLSDSDPATFGVSASNDAPVVTDIPDQTIAEGGTFVTINLDDYVSDIDNTDAEMTWTYTGNTELTVTIDASRVATINIPNIDWYGSETITFTATDPGLLSASDPATFTVTNINDAPVVSDIPDQTIDEGLTFAAINLDDFVSDVDNADSEINWTYSGNTELTVNIDASRVATITIPGAEWNGSETITFTATDPGTLFGSDAATFTVNAVNDAPVVTDIPDQTIDEGSTFATISLDDYVSDVDNVDAEMTWTYSGNTELTVSIDASHIATITIPGADWYGSEAITFTATDPGLLADSDPAVFTVNNINDVPVLSDIPDQTIDEGSTFATMNLDDFVSDVDNADAEIAWTYSGNTELTVSIDGSRVATITTPGANWNGSETITFTATDPGLLSASDPATFTVTSVNDAPVLAAIGSQTVAEGDNLHFTTSATDVDGDALTMTAENLPANATYDDNTDGTGSFDFNPDYTQQGVYNVTFIVSDGALADTEIVQITVTGTNRAPVADAGPDQIGIVLGNTVTLDGTGSSDPENDPINYSWVQVSGPSVTLSDAAIAQPTFDPVSPGDYEFELIVDDNVLFSTPDTVLINVINRDAPEAIADLQIAISGSDLVLTWSAITTDVGGFATDIGRYVIYRGTSAYFVPTDFDSIGYTDDLTLTFTDNDLGGADVVGDTLTQYFYTAVAVDIYENHSATSNRVGEYDYQIVITPTTDFSLICVPFENTGITNAVDLINAIGAANVNTVNNYQPLSQSYESRFAAGFGVNFTVNPGGVYQVNARAQTVFSVAGNIPAPGTVIYNLVTTSTTDYSFIVIPFEMESDFAVAQDVMNSIPGSFNTLNRFIATSQSYESRFAAGFGPNFVVKAGKPYQANAAATAVFPGP